MADLILPKPFKKQREILDDPSPYKVARCGRRFGKTRLDLLAAIVGHGKGERSDKQFKGILQGMDILWISKNWDNLIKVVWTEELQPRFGAIAATEINQNQMKVKLPGYGTLFLVSAEAIKNVLGMGKFVGGSIFDEGSKYPVQDMIRTEIMPLLIDNEGWLILTGTTDCGYDGNKARTTPSGFNEICIETRAGKKRGFKEFHGTAFDNPYISRKALEDLIALYPEGSLDLKQEVYAELVEGGAGRALPDMNWDVHMIEPFEVPDFWTHWGSYDWGYQHNGVFIRYTQDTGGNVFIVESAWHRLLQPAEIGYDILKTIGQVPVRKLMYQIVCGRDVFGTVRARGEDTPKIAEGLMSAGLRCLSPANVDLVHGLNNMREYFAWKESPARPKRTPICRIFDTPNNRRLFDQLEHLLCDPEHPDKPLKVDAVNGKGGDDGPDSCRMGLAARPIIPAMQTDKEDMNAWSPEVLVAEYERTHRVKTVTPKEDTPDYDSAFGYC